MSTRAQTHTYKHLNTNVENYIPAYQKKINRYQQTQTITYKLIKAYMQAYLNTNNNTPTLICTYTRTQTNTQTRKHADSPADKNTKAVITQKHMHIIKIHTE